MALQSPFSGPTKSDASAPPREQRIIERHLAGAREILSSAENAAERLDELRRRLLGLCDPPSDQKNQPVEPVRAELAEFGVVLERLAHTIGVVHSKLNDLQGI